MAKWEHCLSGRNRQENSELCGVCEREGERKRGRGRGRKRRHLGVGVDHTVSSVTGDLSNDRQVICTVMSTSANTRCKESVCGWDLKLPEE